MCWWSPVQVVWQSLQQQSSLAPPESGTLPCAGAVVTSQRVLLVSPELRQVSATPLEDMRSPPTSAVWVGPALLFANAAHQVGWLTMHTMIERLSDQLRRWRGRGLCGLPGTLAGLTCLLLLSP